MWCRNSILCLRLIARWQRYSDPMFEYAHNSMVLLLLRLIDKYILYILKIYIKSSITFIVLVWFWIHHNSGIWFSVFSSSYRRSKKSRNNIYASSLQYFRISSTVGDLASTNANGSITSLRRRRIVRWFNRKHGYCIMKGFNLSLHCPPRANIIGF